MSTPALGCRRISPTPPLGGGESTRAEDFAVRSGWATFSTGCWGLAHERGPEVDTGKALSASLEDYLEALLVLVRERGVARVRDIAERVGVSMPSVNTALKRLAEQGLVNHEPYEFIELTEAGVKAAERVDRRHRTLRRFLAQVLCLPEAVAEADACKMEHGLHPETVAQLQRFLEFMDARTGDEQAPCVLALKGSNEAGPGPAGAEGSPSDE